MRVLFRFALLWKWIEGENPMKLFRLEGSQQRTREPQILTRDELRSVFDHMTLPVVKLAVMIAATTGMRRSELFALKWSDIDWLQGKINIDRGIVDGNVGAVKTPASRKSIPLHAPVAEIFKAVRQSSAYQDETDWVFASPRSFGKMPWDGGGLQQRHIRPAGIAAGLGEHIGWHTLRHSYKTWLDEDGVALTVQRDLMRHADIKTTANVYGAVRLDRMRAASEGAVRKTLQ